jgi:hypothetical protein
MRQIGTSRTAGTLLVKNRARIDLRCDSLSTRATLTLGHLLDSVSKEASKRRMFFANGPQ